MWGAPKISTRSRKRESQDFVDPLSKPFYRLKMTSLLKDWIKALRSRKYDQGRSRLHNPNTNTFCCLGVRCEVAIQHGVPLKKDITGKYDNESYSLPETIREAFRLKHVDGKFHVTPKFLQKLPKRLAAKLRAYQQSADSVTLATLNDSPFTQFSFNDIAKIIEARPKGLFTR